MGVSGVQLPVIDESAATGLPCANPECMCGNCRDQLRGFMLLEVSCDMPTLHVVIIRGTVTCTGAFFLYVRLFATFDVFSTIVIFLGLHPPRAAS